MQISDTLPHQVARAGMLSVLQTAISPAMTCAHHHNDIHANSPIVGAVPTQTVSECARSHQPEIIDHAP